MDELFSTAPVKRVYFKLALPVVLGMITTMIYNLADTMFVAKTGDPRLVAGVTLGAPLFMFMLAVSDIFGLGGSSVVSRLLGEKKPDLAKRVSSFCMYGGIVAGLLLTVILLAFEHPILNLLGAKPATYDAAAAFYRVLSLGAVFIVFSIIPQNLIRTEGLANQAMIASMTGTILAIILDPIFLFIFKWGAAGVALANVIGFVLTDLLLVYFVAKRARIINLDIHRARIDGRTTRDVIAIGIPGSITNFAQTFGMALLNSSLAMYGTDMVAAMGITQKIYGVVTMVIVGFAFGSQPLVGYNYGARQWKRLREILRFDFLVQVCYALVVGSVLLIFARPLTALFMNQPAIVNAGSYMLLATLVTTPLVGLILVYTTVFQSIGNALGAFIISISRQGIIYWIALELLKHSFGYHGIVWAQAVSDIVTCLIGYGLYRASLDWKHRMKDDN